MASCKPLVNASPTNRLQIIVINNRLAPNITDYGLCSLTTSLSVLFSGKRSNIDVCWGRIKREKRHGFFLAYLWFPAQNKTVHHRIIIICIICSLCCFVSKTNRLRPTHQLHKARYGKNIRITYLLTYLLMNISLSLQQAQIMTSDEMSPKITQPPSIRGSGERCKLPQRVLAVPGH